MKAFKLNQRVTVHVVGVEGERIIPLLVGAPGTVCRLRRSDRNAWVRLDARLGEELAHPFPADDAHGRGTHVLAMPQNCEPIGRAALPAAETLHVLREEYRRDSGARILQAVERGGRIQLGTAERLLSLLAKKRPKYQAHLAIEIKTAALLKTIDNEADAQETIRRLEALP